jgi:ribosomal protein S18 acetylase RimI-like enzyme
MLRENNTVQEGIYMTQLRPMTESEFQLFSEESVKQYAEEKVKAGNYLPEEALQNAQDEFNKYLPDGLATQNNYFYYIYDEQSEQKVGILWFAKEDLNGYTRAFVYEIAIDEPFRRRGYAQQAFILLEEKARELGIKKIELHVFGHNHAAIALYHKLGYTTTNIQMAKRLD